MNATAPAGSPDAHGLPEGRPGPESALLALFTPEGRDNPYPHYAALRAHAPVTHIGDGLVVVSGYDELQQSLRDPDLEVHDADFNAQHRPDIAHLPSISLFTDSMLMGRSPGHERVRRLVAQAFTPRSITALTPAIERLAGERIARLAEVCAGGNTADFMNEVAYPLPIHVIGELLGIPRADLGWFRPLVSDLAKVMDPQLTAEVLDAADRAAVELLGYFAALVVERRRRPRQDMVSTLVQARDAGNGRLSDRELHANLVLLFVAGFETTANLLGNSLSVLLEHPEQTDALRADPDRVEQFTQEVLRFDSPIQITGRWAVRDTTVGGTDIPKDSNLVLLLGAGNRDPRRFDDPDVFRPARPDNRPLSFGAGPHYCVGAALARLEAHIALPLLLEHVPRPVRAGEPVRGNWLTVRGYASLPVTSGGR